MSAALVDGTGSVCNSIPPLLKDVAVVLLPSKGVVPMQNWSASVTINEHIGPGVKQAGVISFGVDSGAIELACGISSDQQLSCAIPSTLGRGLTKMCQVGVGEGPWRIHVSLTSHLGNNAKIEDRVLRVAAKPIKVSGTYTYCETAQGEIDLMWP